MAVPKRRSSRSRARKRRAHQAVKPRQLAHCPQCGVALPTHIACPNCGYYQGRTVIETED